MNTRNAADAAQQDQDRTAWRKPRGASLCGPDAILAEAQALDDHTRYVAATPVLEGRGLSVANNGPDNDRTPSVEIGNRHYGLSRSAAGALFQRLGISVRHLGEKRAIRRKRERAGRSGLRKPLRPAPARAIAARRRRTR